MKERTGWREQNESQIEGEEKKSDRLVGAAETSKEHAEWRRLQKKNLKILGLLKRKANTISQYLLCFAFITWQRIASNAMKWCAASFCGDKNCMIKRRFTNFLSKQGYHFVLLLKNTTIEN